MLGVPIGNRDYRRLIAERKLREMQPSTAALQVTGPRIATSLLLQSINLRPLFMMSSDSNPDDIVEYARAFDAQTVSVALYRIICTCTVCTYTYTRYTAYRTLDLCIHVTVYTDPYPVPHETSNTVYH